MAYFATDEDWHKLAKITFAKFIKSGKSPSDESGITIAKAAAGYRAKSCHTIYLPGNQTMIEFREKKFFNDFEFWFCGAGTLMTKYVNFCQMVALTDNDNQLENISFKNCQTIKKSLTETIIALAI